MIVIKQPLPESAMRFRPSRKGRVIIKFLDSTPFLTLHRVGVHRFRVCPHGWPR